MHPHLAAPLPERPETDVALLGSGLRGTTLLPPQRQPEWLFHTQVDKHNRRGRYLNEESVV